MQISARYAAASEILAQIFEDDAPAEKALTHWGRQSRFAGSRDRAAIRDIVFDCLRKKRSYAALFPAELPLSRALVLAHAFEMNQIDEINGQGYSLPPLSAAEAQALKTRPSDLADPVHYDYPDFLHDTLVARYQDSSTALMQALAKRAPLDLRVQAARESRERVIALLEKEGIRTEPLDQDPHALRVLENPRKLQQSRVYLDGLVEIQDLSSQMIARFAKPKDEMQILDYCAGGGGKSLAMAALAPSARIDAWDHNPKRMHDIPNRAKRAGSRINVLSHLSKTRYDLVFVDAPCSGSGAWRRQPDSKWKLSPEHLVEITRLQERILDAASAYVLPSADLVYATCSILPDENERVCEKFLEAHPHFYLEEILILNPLTAGDGFFSARFKQK